MTAFGNYTLRDNQDVSKFYILFQKTGRQWPFCSPLATPLIIHAIAYYTCYFAQYNPSKMNTAAMALFLLSSDNFVSLDGIPIKQVTQV